MKKLIFAIVLVGIIQFAFVVYTQLQAPLNLDVASVQFDAAPFTPSPVSMVDAAPTYEPATISDHTDLRSASRHSGANASAIKRPKMANNELAAKAYSSKPDRTNFALPKPARSADPITVMVSYNETRKNTDCVDPEDKTRPKRSFIAKAAPVVKKPWEWMKALGSKLN